jgi:hypothetical protein
MAGKHPVDWKSKGYVWIAIRVPVHTIEPYFNESTKAGKPYGDLIIRDLEAYDAYVRGCENQRERGH